MKTVRLVCAALAVTPLAFAAVQSLPFQDPFAYTEGNLYSVAAGVWDAGGNTGPELLVTSLAALDAPSGLAAASGHGLKWTPTGTARRSLVQFTPASSDTLYASFLINVVNPPSSGWKLVAYFDSSTSQPSSPQLGFFVSNGSVGVAKKGSTPAATVPMGTGTHLVVVRYTFTGTSTDQVDLWVDPDSSTYSADTAPASSGSASGGNNVVSIPYFGVYCISGTGPSLYLDEVRIATNWSGVTPPAGPVAPLPSPVVTGAWMTVAGLAIQGTNGAPNTEYGVLAATSISLPVEQWTLVAKHHFDPDGNFACTNPVSSASPQRFYLLQVNNLPELPAAPFITSEPQDRTAGEGQNVSYTVAATGTAPLWYQWYSTPNSRLAGKTNTTLTLSGVQTNQSGTGYFVIVTNASGSDTSRVASLTVYPTPTNGTFYVATNGSDSNPGTLAEPFRTLTKAIALSGPGATIYVRGGTHAYGSTIRIEHSGTPAAPIRLWAFPGEQPVINFSSQPYGSANRGFLITTNGNWWDFKGLEICYAGDNGIKVEGSHHRFEQCVFHQNGDTGLQIGFGHDDDNPGGLLAAFVEVVNCDSYLNYDPDSNGGDADGFAAKMHCGQGIVFTGCRAWENSDDGWDLFETDYTIVISNCWTWKSGVGQGNGNGFKLGGNGAGGDSKGTHYAYHCVSFGHKVNGFTQNSHKDGLVVQHCLGFANGNSGYNYFMEGSLNSGKQNVFRNNASIPRTGTNGGGFIEDNNPVQENNSWNLPVTVNAADFVSLAEAAALAPRNPDGSLPTGFARLVAGSDLIDQGVDVGIPFNGTAPDLGAFEYTP